MRWTLDEAVVDLAGRCVRWPDREVELTDQEAALLRYLALRSGEPASREQLLVDVWGFAASSRSRAVDHAVRRLRTKIEVEPNDPRFLLTVRGLGYRLALPSVPMPGHDAGGSGLVGRSELLHDLHEAASRHAQLTVVGPAGIGKTALTLAWARRHGLPVARLASIPASGMAGALAAQMEVPIAPGATDRLAIDRVGRALVGRGIRRVVLDDVDGVAAAVRELVDTWGRLGLVVVVTCQVPLGVPGETLFGVPRLEPTAAARLLLGEASLPAPDTPSHRLLERLGGHPLSLLVAAAQLRDLSTEAVVALVDDPEADDRARASVATGIERLAAPAQATLYALSLGPDLPLTVVAQATGQPMRAIQRHVATLRRCAVLEPGPLVPELVRRAILATPRPELMVRVADQLVEAEVSPALQAVVAGHVEAHDTARAARLWRAACRPMLLHGPVHLAWADHAVTTSEGEERAEALVLRGALRTLAGDLAGAAADLDEAEPQEAPLTIERSLRQGWLSLLHGDHAAAREQLGQALRQARRSGQPRLEAMAEVRLASLTHRRGDVNASVRHLRRALGLYEALDDAVQSSRARANLAMMHVELGEHGDARQLLEAALASDRAAGVWAAVPQHLLNLGGLLLDCGELDEAEAQLTEARSEAVRFGDRETEGLALLSLGVVRMLRGQGASALTPITQGRTLLQETTNVVGAGMAWAYEALACAVADAPDEGHDALDEARHLLGGLGVAALTELLDTVDATVGLARGDAPMTPPPSPSPLSFVRVAQRVYASEAQRRTGSGSGSGSGPVSLSAP